MATLASNVYFPSDFEDKEIYEILRKNVDIFNACRIVDDKEEIGKAVICIDDTEMDKVENAIQKDKDYYVSGESEINLLGTTIAIEALIIEKICT
jgi:hypothetical protein